MIKKSIVFLCSILSLALLSACGEAEVKSYNEGIHIIPQPQELVEGEGQFVVNSSTSMGATTDEAKTIAEFFAAKISASTGYDIKVAEEGNIRSASMKPSTPTTKVTPSKLPPKA